MHGSSCVQQLTIRANVGITILIKDEVGTRESPILTIRFIDDRYVRGDLLVIDDPIERLCRTVQRSTLALPSRARITRTDFPGALRLTDLLEPPGRRDLVIFVLAKLLVGRFRVGADDGA